MGAEYFRHAQLAEEFDLKRAEGDFFFVSVACRNGWPTLVVAQKFAPSQGGFNPGILLVPETKVLFIGAGERLKLDPPSRLWEDKCDSGFWSWSQHHDYALMAAELELAAWDWNGRKLWTTFVEPPWEYEVVGDVARIDVMGRKSEFPLATGPKS
jgi:hypothetical protein